MKKSVRVVMGIFAVLLLLLGIALLLQSKKWEGFAEQKTVTFYFLEGCGWCEKFKPEWASFKELAAKEGIVTREVSASENPKEVEEKGIQGFPTVIVTSGGQDKEYNGERTADDLLKFAKSA